MFLKLGRALQKKLSEHEVNEFDLHIADPNEDLVRTVRRVKTTGGHASEPQEIMVKFDGAETTAVVYRMTGELSSKNVSLAHRRFNRLYKELVAAA